MANATWFGITHTSPTTKLNYGHKTSVRVVVSDEKDLAIYLGRRSGEQGLGELRMRVRHIQHVDHVEPRHVTT